jgi:hypothetical protein
VSGIVTGRKHHYIQKQWPKSEELIPGQKTANTTLINTEKSLFTSAAHQIWTQPVFKKKSNYPDFPHIRISGI